MKLILTVLSDNETEPVSYNLIQSGFRVTRIASTGGFLRRGMSTLMLGVEDEKVQQAIQLINQSLSTAKEPDEKHGVIFVLPVEGHIQI